MKRLLFIVLVSLLVALAGCYLWKVRNVGTEPADLPRYTEAKAERRSIKQEVSCSGVVGSNLDVEIKCKATGEVVELPFDISDSVQKGDLLLKVDPVNEERTVRQAEVKLASAEAKLARATQNLSISERDLERARKEASATLRAAQASSKDLRAKAERAAALQEKKFASPEEAGSAEAEAVQGESALQRAAAGIDGVKVKEAELELLRQDIKLAQADADSIRIDLETAKQRLKETQVYAPISGVVSDRLVQVGQIIASPTMNVGGGTSLLVISDLSRIFVGASVDESDFGLVRPGQRVIITVDGFPDDVFTGEVVRVATKGKKVSNVVTFEVKIELLDEAKGKLRPEMTADVKILVAAKDNVVSVPSECVIRRGANKVVLMPGTAGAPPVETPITAGIDDGVYTEIIQGVTEGATVLIKPDQTDTTSEDKGPFGAPPPGGGPPPGG